MVVEIYWDEDDDWGRHSYSDIYRFGSWSECEEHLEAMRLCDWCYNISYVTLYDEDDEDERPM